MRQLADYLMARKADLLTQPIQDRTGDQQLRAIDKHLAITYDRLMRNGSKDDEVIKPFVCIYM
jgi:hypothetical protein